MTIPTAKVRALDQKSQEEKKLPEDGADTRVFLTDQSTFTEPGDPQERLHGRAFRSAGKSQNPAEIHPESPVQPAKPGAPEAEGNAVPALEAKDSSLSFAWMYAFDLPTESAIWPALMLCLRRTS